jgi:L-malate glycosyltransferase
MGSYQKIAVCHILSGDLWAGAEVQAYLLLLSLRTEPRLDISVIVLNEGKLASLFREAGIRVTIIDETRNSFRTIVKKACAELAGRRIDILHSHRYKENLLGVLLRRCCAIDHLVQTVHGAPEPQSGFKGLKAGLYCALNRFASRRFDRIIAVSDDLHRLLSDRFDPTKIITVHNAVDVAQVVPVRPATVVRKELGIGVNQLVVGAVGRMVPVKGFDRFIDVAKVIAREKSAAVFLLVGDGPLLDEYRRLVHSLGLDNQVRLPGFRNDILDIVNCFDLFVMTSYHEGIPIGLLEAMALKRPVVAISVGGISEVIEHNISGVLVDSGDIDVVAEACLELLAHPDRAQILGEAARHRVETKFSIAVHRDRVLALYKDVVGTK